MFDLKTMLDYLDTIFNSFDEERLARKSYEEMVAPFEKKLRKTNRIMKDIYNQLDDIKNMYDLSDDDLKEIMFIIEYKRKRNEERHLK